MTKLQALDLLLDVNNFEVSQKGKTLPMPKLSFELLLFLIQHSGNLCTYEAICTGVWRDTQVSDETVTQRVRLLRKSLGENPKYPRYIESVRGRGYRFIAASQEIIVDPPVKKDRTKFYLVLTLILLLATLALSIVLFNSQNKAVLSSAASGSSLNSSTNIRDRAFHYLRVGQLKNLQTSASLFRKWLTSHPEDARALVGLSNALSLSVCRYNQPAQLATDAQLLAQKAIELDSTSSRAYEALGLSFDCLGKRDLALQSYLHSIELDPLNSASLGSAAHLYESQGELLLAYQLNTKADRLAPNSPMIKLQFARINELMGANDKAEATYSQLFELYPDNVFINAAYPRFLYYIGRFNDAKAAFEIALDRDIERNGLFANYAELLWLLEDKSSALPWFEKAAKANPNQSFANSLWNLLGEEITASERQKQIKHLETGISQGDTWPKNYLEASLLISLGDNSVGNNSVEKNSTAIGYLQDAVNLGYRDSNYLLISPLFSQLRESPKFFQLIDHINQLRRESQQQITQAQQ